jgi:hypothetical protein
MPLPLSKEAFVMWLPIKRKEQCYNQKEPNTENSKKDV